MKIADWTKFATLLMVCGGIIALGFYRIINEQAVVAVLSAALGYVFGNGHKVISDRGIIKNNLISESEIRSKKVSKR